MNSQKVSHSRTTEGFYPWFFGNQRTLYLLL